VRALRAKEKREGEKARAHLVEISEGELTGKDRETIVDYKNDI